MACPISPAWSVGADGLLHAPILPSPASSPPCGAGRLAGHFQTAAVLLPESCDGWRARIALVFAVRTCFCSFLRLGAGTAAGLYLSLAIWGPRSRQYAATKFSSFTPPAAPVVQILRRPWPWASRVRPPSLNLPTFPGGKGFGTRFERWALYAAPADRLWVKLPIVRLHTCCLDAPRRSDRARHIVAGRILLKMGGYAACFALPTAAACPQAPRPDLRRCWWFLGWSTSSTPPLTSFAQRNLKRQDSPTAPIKPHGLRADWPIGSFQRPRHQSAPCCRWSAMA